MPDSRRLSVPHEGACVQTTDTSRGTSQEGISDTSQTHAEATLPVEFSLHHDGYVLRGLRWGRTENPAVLLLHGFMQSAQSWTLIAEALACDYCVYALDFVGHGNSSISLHAKHYAYEEMAASVDAVLRKVIGRPAAVIGYSMGGRIALKTLETSGDMIAALVLESCNVGCYTEAERLEAERRNRAWAQHLCQKGIESFVEYWEELPLFATQREQGFDKTLRPGRLRNDAGAMARCLEGAGKHAMPFAGETLDRLAAIVRPSTSGQTETVAFALTPSHFAAGEDSSSSAFSPSRCAVHGEFNDSVMASSCGIAPIPVLYIWGSKDAKSAAVAQEFERRGASVASIPVGHNVHLEAPMLYLEKVRNFLSCEMCTERNTR